MKTRTTPPPFVMLTAAILCGISFADADPDHTPGPFQSEVLVKAISPDGRLYAIYYRDGWDEVIAIHDADTKKQLGKIVGHGDDVRALSFSADGRQLASSSADKGFALWDVSTGKLLLRLPAVNHTDRWAGDLGAYGFRRKGSIHKWQGGVESQDSGVDHPPRKTGKAEPGSAAKGEGEEISWVDFSAARLEELRAGDQPILVFCRANWDLNAEVVDQTVFADKRVIAAIRRQGYTLLHADFTRRSEEIEAFIREVGGAAGSVNVVVFRGPKTQMPVLLKKRGRNVITAEDVLDAMTRERRWDDLPNEAGLHTLVMREPNPWGRSPRARVPWYGHRLMSSLGALAHGQLRERKQADRHPGHKFFFDDKGRVFVLVRWREEFQERALKELASIGGEPREPKFEIRSTEEVGHPKGDFRQLDEGETVVMRGCFVPPEKLLDLLDRPLIRYIQGGTGFAETIQE